MEPEMNSENYAQPFENQIQPETYPQPGQNRQDWLQKTWLNVNIETWLQFLIIIAILFIATVKTTPKYTLAQPRRQNTPTYNSGYQNECYEYESQYYDEYYYDE
jgi:hypothetical protein